MSSREEESLVDSAATTLISAGWRHRATKPGYLIPTMTALIGFIHFEKCKFTAIAISLLTSVEVREVSLSFFQHFYPSDLSL
jgi:hypothetical protein